ncbi:MAG: MptD family putative ECF transporter S component [Lachnospiraceae bacterium]
MKEKLKTKDLIYAGAFAAIYLVLVFVLAMATAIVPIAFIIRPLIIGIVCAPVYMLYITKVKKLGAIIILGILVGLISFSSIYSFAFSVVFAILAALVAKSGNFKSKSRMKISFWVFNLNVIGHYLILLYAKPQYIAMCETYSGAEYAQTMDTLTPWWIIFVLIGLAVIGAIIGTAFSDKMMKKHFEKSGLV